MHTFTLSYSVVKYFRSIPAYAITVPERHGETDRQTDGRTDDITALCVASRGKKTVKIGA